MNARECLPWAPWPHRDVRVKLRPTFDLRGNAPRHMRGPTCGPMHVTGAAFADGLVRPLVRESPAVKITVNHAPAIVPPVAVYWLTDSGVLGSRSWNRVNTTEHYWLFPPLP